MGEHTLYQCTSNRRKLQIFYVTVFALLGIPLEAQHRSDHGGAQCLVSTTKQMPELDSQHSDSLLPDKRSTSSQWAIYIILQVDGHLYEPAMRAMRELENGFKNNPSLEACVDLIQGSRGTRYIFKNGKLRQERLAIDDLMSTFKNGCKQIFQPYSDRKTCVIFSGHGSGVLTPVWDSKAMRWTYEKDVGDSAYMRYCQQQEKAFWQQLLQHADSSHMAGDASLDLAMDAAILDADHQKSIFLDPQAERAFSLSQLQELLAWLSIDCLGKKIDVIGCDACSMALLEVAYTVREHGRCFIASQAPEEKEGWSYGSLLEIMASEVEAPRISRRIVHAYEAARRLGCQPRYSLSAWDLAATADLVFVLGRVVQCIAAACSTTEGMVPALMAARQRSIPFWERFPYADLKTFLEHLLWQIDSLKETPEQVALRRAIVHALEKTQLMILATASSSGELLTGCSIYFPHAVIDRSYCTAALPQWYDFLQMFVEGKTS